MHIDPKNPSSTLRAQQARPGKRGAAAPGASPFSTQLDAKLKHHAAARPQRGAKPVPAASAPAPASAPSPSAPAQSLPDAISDPTSAFKAA